MARAIRLTSSRAPLHQRGRSTQQTCGHYVGDNYLGSVHYVVQQIPFQMVSPLSRLSRHFVMPCRQRLAKFCIVQLPATKISQNICPSGICGDGRLFHLRRVHVAAEIADSRVLRRAWAFSLSQSCCARALTVSVDIVQGLATCGRASAHLHSCQHGRCCEFIRAARIVRIDSIPCRAGSRNPNTSRTLVLSRGNALATRLAVSTMAMRSSAGPCKQSRA
jgi:hypothetical protein